MPENIRHLIDGWGYIVFDTEAEMRAVYNTIVGDDGPTASNPYSGPARVYAKTFHSDGLIYAENT